MQKFLAKTTSQELRRSGMFIEDAITGISSSIGAAYDFP